MMFAGATICIPGELRAQSVEVGSSSDARAAVVADPAKKREARAHFMKGVELLHKGSLAEALAEFLVSRELYPTRAATMNAALVLNAMNLLADALDMCETLLREFPALPDDEKAEADRLLDELSGKFGTLTLRGGQPGAIVKIDGQERGRWPLEKPLRLAAGEHLIRVEMPGFVTVERKVSLEGRQTREVWIPLDRAMPPDPPKAAAQRIRRFAADGSAAPMLTPSFGGQVVSDCGEGCNAGVGAGMLVKVHGSYRLSSAWSAGVTAGYLMTMQHLARRKTTLTLAPKSGSTLSPGAHDCFADDALALHGVAFAPTSTLSWGVSYPLRVRLASGIFLGSLSDARSGVFYESGSEYSAESQSGKQMIAAAYLNPEVRIGLRMNRLELSAGMDVLVLVPFSIPVYNEKRINVNRHGLFEAYGDYNEMTMIGSALVAFAPGVGVRYEF